MLSNSTKYYVPEQSKLPFFAALTLLTMVVGFASWLTDIKYGAPSTASVIIFLVGFALLLILIVSWFNIVIDESESGMNNKLMDLSYRQGMLWFIFSEICFFFAFFFALFYIRFISVEWLGSNGAHTFNYLLWPDFITNWPLINTPDPSKFPAASGTIPAFGLPLINTILLVASSFTISISHHALLKDNRKKCNLYLFITIALGVIFLFLQAYEYVHAYNDLGLTLNSGAYGSTFFLLTGFHGFHVTLGTLMLIVILLRLLKGHMSKDHHFGFEAIAWYWHFVDVVWVGLFIFVYVL